MLCYLKETYERSFLLLFSDIFKASQDIFFLLKALIKGNLPYLYNMFLILENGLKTAGFCHENQ